MLQSSFHVQPSNQQLNSDFVSMCDPEKIFQHDSDPQKESMLQQLAFSGFRVLGQDVNVLQRIFYTYQVALQYAIFSKTQVTHQNESLHQRMVGLKQERSELFEELVDTRDAAEMFRSKMLKQQQKWKEQEKMGESQKYKCKICGNAYPLQYALQSHMLKRHAMSVTEAYTKQRGGGEAKRGASMFDPNNTTSISQWETQLAEKKLENAKIHSLESEIGELKRVIEEMHVNMRVEREVQQRERSSQATSVAQQGGMDVATSSILSMEAVSLFKAQQARLDMLEQKMILAHPQRVSSQPQTSSPSPMVQQSEEVVEGRAVPNIMKWGEAIPLTLQQQQRPSTTVPSETGRGVLMTPKTPRESGRHSPRGTTNEADDAKIAAIGTSAPASKKLVAQQPSREVEPSAEALVSRSTLLNASHATASTGETLEGMTPLRPTTERGTSSGMPSPSTPNVTAIVPVAKTIEKSQKLPNQNQNQQQSSSSVIRGEEETPLAFSPAGGEMEKPVERPGNGQNKMDSFVSTFQKRLETADHKIEHVEHMKPRYEAKAQKEKERKQVEGASGDVQKKIFQQQSPQENDEDEFGELNASLFTPTKKEIAATATMPGSVSPKQQGGVNTGGNRRRALKPPGAEDDDDDDDVQQVSPSPARGNKDEKEVGPVSKDIRAENNKKGPDGEEDEWGVVGRPNKQPALASQESNPITTVAKEKGGITQATESQQAKESKGHHHTHQHHSTAEGLRQPSTERGVSVSSTSSSESTGSTGSTNDSGSSSSASSSSEEEDEGATRNHPFDDSDDGPPHHHQKTTVVVPVDDYAKYKSSSAATARKSAIVPHNVSGATPPQGGGPKSSGLGGLGIQANDEEW